MFGLWRTPQLLSATTINYPSRRTKKRMNDESKQHVQWIERNRNNRFMNLLSLPELSEISGTVHLGLTAGRQADKIQVNFDFFKTHSTLKHSTYRFV